MKNILLFTFFPLLLFAFLPWGQNGHRIVAEVCQRNLTEKAKTEVEKILGKELLAEVSTWPDYIRSEKNWDFAKEWHYVTIDTDYTVKEFTAEGAKNPKIENVIEAIELMTAVLKNDPLAISQFEKIMKDNKVRPLNNSTRATALAFFIHFVGDIHQPMHVGKNKDLGGNKIKVLFFSEESNLHAVWDEGIIEKEQLSYTEFTTFINKLSAEEISRLQQNSVEDWARESIALRERIYDTLYDNVDRETGLPNFYYNYQHDYRPLVEDQLLAAGVRAAGILNTIFQ